MSGVVRIVTPVVKTVGPLIKKYGPLALALWPKVQDYFAKHPDIQDRARAAVADVQRRLTDALTKRGLPAQIRASLDVIRQEAERQGPEFDPAPWLQRPDRIESGLRVAERPNASGRKAALARQKASVDRLADEFMLAIAESTPRPDFPPGSSN